MTEISIHPGRVRLYTGQPRIWMVEDPGPLLDLERRMARVKAGSRRLVGRRSGLLYSTIRNNNGVNARGPYVDTIAGKPGLKYTMAHHDGTGPHEIRPRKRKVLRFSVGGRVVFRTRVMHPGTKGTRFLTEALPLAAG